MDLHLFMDIGNVSGRFKNIGSVIERFNGIGIVKNICSVISMWFNVIGRLRTFARSLATLMMLVSPIVTFFGAMISTIFATRSIVSGVITLGKG